jgi:hypothetical protein
MKFALITDQERRITSQYRSKTFAVACYPLVQPYSALFQPGQPRNLCGRLQPTFGEVLAPVPQPSVIWYYAASFDASKYRSCGLDISCQWYFQRGCMLQPTGSHLLLPTGTNLTASSFPLLDLGIGIGSQDCIARPRG